MCSYDYNTVDPYLCQSHRGKRVPEQLLLFAAVSAPLAFEYPRSGQRGRAHPVADQKHDVFRPRHFAAVTGQTFFQRFPRLVVPIIAI